MTFVWLRHVTHRQQKYPWSAHLYLSPFFLDLTEQSGRRKQMSELHLLTKIGSNCPRTRIFKFQRGVFFERHWYTWSFRYFSMFERSSLLIKVPNVPISIV